jgi:GT2 family glycosyltransferase
VLESARERTIELVVIDNASSDGSVEAIREAYADVRLIQNSTNLGFGAACNQGIRATDCKFVLLLNSDARLNAQAFQALCDCMERNERCGVAGCRLIDASGAEVVNTRHFLTPLNQAVELTGIKAGLQYLKRTHRTQLDRRLADCAVDWIDGACLLLRRSALDEVGTFDERFFMYSEDEDLCFRLRQRGWQVCFCGGGTALHIGGASSQFHKSELLRQFYRSQMLFLSKHRGKGATFLYAVLMKTVLILKRWLAVMKWRAKTHGSG